MDVGLIEPTILEIFVSADVLIRGSQNTGQPTSFCERGDGTVN
jgi:hypothetical protein